MGRSGACISRRASLVLGSMGTSPVPGTWVHRSRPDAGNQWYGLVVWVSWGWPGTKVGWELGFARAHLETGPAGASLVLVWAMSLGLWDPTGSPDP